MANIVMVGGGICGLGTALRLSRRGHTVTLLERNPHEPPASIEEAWEAWERPAVGQFRQGHWFMARFREIVERELPELIGDFMAVGALRTNVLRVLPPWIEDRSPRPGDEELDVVTGRRPTFEWVMARAAEADPNIEIRRGVGVAGLVTGPSALNGVPHVTGVRTEAGDELGADLVIDAGGRRSALAAWLEAIGARPFDEQAEDFGFRYYGRYFRARNGGLPGLPFAVIAAIGSAGALVLPSDNQTWFIGIAAASKDKALYGLAQEDRWTAAVATIPMVGDWLDGDPIGGLDTIVGVPDRHRRFVVDGTPVATGIAAIGDAWAATNPSLGRGISMGYLQASAVVDSLDELDDPGKYAVAVDEAVERTATPYYRATNAVDRATMAIFEAEREGREMPTHADPAGAFQAAFMKARFLDPDVFRAFGRIGNVLSLPEEVAMTEPVFSKVLALADADPPPLPPGPTRRQLVAIASGQLD